MDKGMAERRDGCTVERMNKLMKENGWMNARTNEYMDEWMTEWRNGWMDRRMRDEWIIEYGDKNEWKEGGWMDE